MGLASFAILALSLGHASVDVAAITARVPVVLESLSKALGRSLGCEDAFENRVVFVEANDLPEESVLQGIAEAVDGKWVTRGDSLVLLPDRGVLDAKRLDWRKASLQRLREAAAEVKKGFPENFDAEAALALQAKYRKLQGGQEPTDFRASQTIAYASPLGRLVFELLSTLDLGEAAADEGGGLHLYSNKPSPTFERVAIPAALLRTYDKEQAVWDSFIDTVRVDGALSSNDYAAERATSQLPADRVCIAFGRYGASPSCVVSVVVFDNNGAVKGIARFNVFLRDFDQLFVLPTSNAEGAVTLSEKARQFLSYFALDDSYRRLERSHPLYAQILDPMQHEPLSYWIGELVGGLGKHTGGNVFASLDDNLYWDFSRLLQAETVSARDVERTLTRVSHFEVRHGATFTVVEQQDPDRAARCTFPREPLGRLLRELDTNGYLSIESLIDWCRLDPSAHSVSPIVFNEARIVVAGYERFMQDADKGMLGILAALQPGERKPFLAGEALTVGLLARDTQRALNELFGSRVVWEFLSSYRGYHVPTELRIPLTFSDGLPAELQLVPTIGNGKGMALWNAANQNFTAWTSFGRPSRLASNIASFARSKIEHRFWYGDALELTITGRLGGTTVDTGDLFVPFFDIRTNPAKLEDLPEDLRRKASGGGQN